MKAELTLSGELKIIAETELEGYALSKWIGENFENPDGPNILIVSKPTNGDREDE